MKRFLCLNDLDRDNFAVTVRVRPEPVLALGGGRASPFFPADGRDREILLPEEGALALLIPHSARQLLAILLYDCPDWVGVSTYITHGLASVFIMTPDLDSAQEVLAAGAEQINASEIWPHSQGRVDRQLVRVTLPTGAHESWCALVDDDNLPYGMASQIRQFNSNVSYLASFAQRYLPELCELVEWLCESVNSHADHCRQPDDVTVPSTEYVRQLISRESLIVELNSVLSLYISQATQGAMPIHAGSYPVGEYSLLGIGGMARSIWRLYVHLHDVFASFDHAGRIQHKYRELPSFDPYAASNRADYGTWEHNAAALELISNSPSTIRFHIPHFSSRWGFHESYYGISVSWQCIHAAATSEWNLLTFTHEYLHSHVRDLLGEILNIGGDRSELELMTDRYNRRDDGDNALQSMQLALVEALIGIHGAGRSAARLTGEGGVRESMRRYVSPDQVLQLMQEHGGFIHELIVHLLDFLYIYDGRDETYVRSIWSSWSRVPIVNAKVEHYVLRTLCALAANSTADTPRQVFNDAVERFKSSLDAIDPIGTDRPAIAQARMMLEDRRSLMRLSVECISARYVINLARFFFFDSQVHAALVDDLHAVVDSTGRHYDVEVGQFSADFIESPLAFLLDRFESYGPIATPSAEYESLWQMLSLS